MMEGKVRIESETLFFCNSVESIKNVSTQSEDRKLLSRTEPYVADVTPRLDFLVVYFKKENNRTLDHLCCGNYFFDADTKWYIRLHLVS